jgi:hypothetical protein
MFVPKFSYAVAHISDAAATALREWVLQQLTRQVGTAKRVSHLRHIKLWVGLIFLETTALNATLQADRLPLTRRGFGLRLPLRLSAIEARMRSFKAASSTLSRSWMSTARLTFPSRLELNSPEGVLQRSVTCNLRKRKPPLLG